MNVYFVIWVMNKSKHNWGTMVPDKSLPRTAFL